jgi:acyl-CoA dehydrogenase
MARFGGRAGLISARLPIRARARAIRTDADQAMQTHGGFGYPTEYDLERYRSESRLIASRRSLKGMVLNYLVQHVLALPRLC